MKFTALAAATLLFTTQLFAGSGKHTADKATAVVKISKPGIYQGYSQPIYKGYTYKSYYVPMRDSVLIAVDVFLPKGLKKGEKIPALLYPTRYNRSIKAKFPLSLLKDPILVIVKQEEVEYFTSYGYACIITDARGTGASTGIRSMEFSPDETKDGAEIAEWIAKQDWSNQKIATSGVSYGATMAEMLLANKSPYIKACIPRSGIFDLYNNVMFPGGVCQGPFVNVWEYTTRSLETNHYTVFTKKGRLLMGVHPVQGDKRGKIYKSAMQLHKQNFNVFEGLKTVKYRDDYNTLLKASADDFSVHSQRANIEASGAAIYRIGGWYDGALARSCTDGFTSTANTKKVLIGPWDHGPQSNVSPFAPAKDINFSIYSEMLRFLDYYLKGIDNGIQHEPALTYYTVGAEMWENSATWPVKNTSMQKYYLSADGGVKSNATAIQPGSTSYKIDYTATTGVTSRWNSLTHLYMHGKTNYADRGSEDKKLLCYTANPFEKEIEITGHPVIKVQLSADATDASVFCYLEDVGPDSTVTYVTEGLLHLPFRKVSDDAAYATIYPDHSYKVADVATYKPGETVELVFDLLPISYKFAAGHSLRVSFAGTDAGHFDVCEQKANTFIVSSTRQAPSYIELPVVSR